MMMPRKEIDPGTDHVLADLGFDDAEELSAKTVLAVKRNALIGCLTVAWGASSAAGASPG